MRFTIRLGIATAIASAAIPTAFVLPATAQPTIYDPEIFPCEHLFRAPWEAPSPNVATYWSPFGTTGIVCYDNGTGMADYYQRDPMGAWHDMNELSPGQFFYSIFTTSIPDQAHWR